jgi:L-ascorbate metabolism protein UlaG (beta-lactamase superfamily)
MVRAVVLTALVLLAPQFALRAPRVSGQEPKEADKKVTLRWFGQSFFQLETSAGVKIVFDPHAIPQFGRPLVKADIVLITHPHVDHNQVAVLDTPEKGYQLFQGVEVQSPKKSEWKKIDQKVGKVRIRTLGTFHDSVNGMRLGKNSAWIVEADDLVFCHLGDLGHDLTDEQVKAIGPVDVLMVPVGGVYTLNGEGAKRVVEKIKPRLYVLPMHYGVPGFDDLVGPDEFLDGQKNGKKLPDTNELVIPVGMKAPDAPTVVLLGWEKKEPKK